MFLRLLKSAPLRRRLVPKTYTAANLGVRHLSTGLRPLPRPLRPLPYTLYNDLSRSTFWSQTYHRGLTTGDENLSKKKIVAAAAATTAVLAKAKRGLLPKGPSDPQYSQYMAYLGSSKGIAKLLKQVKWLMLRQNRPFNADDLSAFFSWILMGNVLFIVIGTTTFVGLILFLGNLLTGQELSKRVMRKLVSIDNNLVLDTSSPDFKATYAHGAIVFRSVAVRSADNNPVKFDFDVDKIRLTLSFKKWRDGKGLVNGINISGMEGKVIFPDQGAVEDTTFSDTYETGHFKISDSRIIMDGSSFKKPFVVDIFTCETEKLRKPWLVYDFLNADALSGSFNGSLFTLHKRQNRYAHFDGMDEDDAENDNNPWKKISRVRIDQIDLSDVYGPRSKLNWVSSGKAELIVDVMLPNDDEPANKPVPQTIWERTTEECSKLYHSEDERARVKQAIVDFIKQKPQPADAPAGAAPTTTTEGSIVAATAPKEPPTKYVVMDYKINLYDVKAAYPQQLPYSALTHMPYISDSDMRALTTFINDKKFGLATASDSLKPKKTVQDDPPVESDGTNPDDTTEIANTETDVSPLYEDTSIPPLKFRSVVSLKRFEYLDFPSLVTLTSSATIDRVHCTPEERAAFEHTNEVIDSLMSEALSVLMLYKEEMRYRLMQKYSRRSGIQILFNNPLFANLLLVGLGSFAI